MPRIPPLSRQEWPVEMKAALRALVPPAPRHPLPRRDPGRPKGLNLLGTMARHPALMHAFHTFNGHLLFATTISARQRELLVLRVAAVRDAAYEWAQHLVQAADAGLTSAEIAAVAEGSQAPSWAPLDRALIQAVDELIADATVSDETWRTLAHELDEQQLMDVVFTVGAYDMLAMAFRSFEIDLDDDLRPATTSHLGGPA